MSAEPADAVTQWGMVRATMLAGLIVASPAAKLAAGMVAQGHVGRHLVLRPVPSRRQSMGARRSRGSPAQREGASVVRHQSKRTDSWTRRRPGVWEGFGHQEK